MADREVEELLRFYRDGRREGSFDSGIQFALERLLADPKLLFRIERDPVDVGPDAVYGIGDFELASRLSFFLWSSVPDEELLEIAEDGRLNESTVLETQVRRMLKDPRAHSLITNFAAQWLYLRNVDQANPEAEVMNVVNHIADNQRADAIDKLQDLLYARSSDAIGKYKQSVANTLFDEPEIEDKLEEPSNETDNGSD